MEYFLGLIFDPSSIHHTKIECFRRRFDSKFIKQEKLQLTILPPFTVDFTSQNQEQDFSEELIELLEGHLYGLTEISQIEFKGINFSAGKKGVISLTPTISPDIIHCQESLYFFLKEYGVKFKNNKNTFNPILPIGRFDYIDLMESAIEAARIEFSDPFILDARSIVLFEKTPLVWKENNNLFDFELRDHFFFVNHLYA
jgi:hypothetical protein